LPLPFDAGVNALQQAIDALDVEAGGRRLDIGLESSREALAVLAEQQALRTGGRGDRGRRDAARGAPVAAFAERMLADRDATLEHVPLGLRRVLTRAALPVALELDQRRGGAVLFVIAQVALARFAARVRQFRRMPEQVLLVYQFDVGSHCFTPR